MSSLNRPRLLYLNGPWDYLGERMRRSYILPFRKLLEQDFEVISVEGDCCFRSEVEKHRPDATLFHTGCEAPGEPEIQISNTDAFPELPRIGYIYRDPFSPSRGAAMNRLRAWGVEDVATCFRPSDAPIDYFRNTFYLPWWVDDSQFRDYGELKEFPITLTGAGWFVRCIYTWRQEIAAELVPRFPVFHAPSLGNRQTNHDLVGEDYARLLNRSFLSAGCGTACRYLTLKLLEIPAARSCLIAEEIEVLKALGFVDGVNCVFATPKNVVEKVQHLLNNREKLQAITDAGFELVHQRHTQRQRRLFAEWFQLRKIRRAHERIVQPHPFEALQLTDAIDRRSHFPSENPILDQIVQGYGLLERRRWAEALTIFEAVVKLIPCIAEARLGAALCLIRLGRPAQASPHLGYNLNLLLQHFRFSTPDPIDVTFTALLCLRMKDTATATVLLGRFPELRHPSLNALRWLMRRANPELGSHPAFQVAEGDEWASVESVHLLRRETFAQWSALLTEFLR